MSLDTRPRGGLGGFLASLLGAAGQSAQQQLLLRQQREQEEALNERKRLNDLKSEARVLGVVPRFQAPTVPAVLRNVISPGGQDIVIGEQEVVPDEGPVITKTPEMLENQIAGARQEDRDLRRASVEALTAQREKKVEEPGAAEMATIKSNLKIWETIVTDTIEKEGRVYTQKDDGTIGLANPLEIQSELMTQGPLFERERTNRQVDLINAREHARLEANKTMAAIDFANDVALENIASANDLARAERIAALKKNEGWQGRWRNFNSRIITDVSNVSHVKQVLNDITKKKDAILDDFGPADRRVNTFNALSGGAGGASTKALIAELKTAIYDRAGSAWTANEIQALEPLVPQEGSFFFLGDNDAEVEAKIDNLHRVIDNKVASLINAELANGKEFDTSVLIDLGFKLEDLNITPRTILAAPAAVGSAIPDEAIDSAFEETKTGGR